MANIIVLSEHGLKSYQTVTTVIAPGYCLKVHYGIIKIAKAVAMFVDHNLWKLTEIIDISQYWQHFTFETELVKIKLQKLNINILGTYQSPGGNLDQALDALSDIIKKNRHWTFTFNYHGSHQCRHTQFWSKEHSIKWDISNR